MYKNPYCLTLSKKMSAKGDNMQKHMFLPISSNITDS